MMSRHPFLSLPSFLALALTLPLGGSLAACAAHTDEESVQPAPEDPSTQSDDLKKKSKKKPKLSCASVGGSCVGLAPSSCIGGTWADANAVSCGGGLGVGCCVLPQPPPPPPPPPPSECPELTPPSPSFCPNGKVSAIHDDQTGCVVGFECTPAPATKCEDFGGSCVGLAPSSCPSGKWGDATTHSCGPGIGVGCCLP